MVPEIKIGKESQKGPKMMKCAGQESSIKLVKVQNVVLVNMLQWRQSLPTTCNYPLFIQGDFFLLHVLQFCGECLIYIYIYYDPEILLMTKSTWSWHLTYKIDLDIKFDLCLVCFKLMNHIYCTYGIYIRIHSDWSVSITQYREHTSIYMYSTIDLHWK